MQGLFGALHIAKRGLMASQIGIQVTGHNISNANTPGFSRQRVDFTESLPLNYPPIGVLGMGVEVASILRVRDSFIDQQLSRERTLEGYFGQMNDYMTQIEATVNEPSDIALNARLNRFFASWQEISKYPGNSSIRIAVAEEGRMIADDIRNMYQKLDAIKTDVNNNVFATVENINQYAAKIAHLNDNIAKMEVNGDSANDYRDERDRLVDDLSKLVNITTAEQQDGTINVYIPGYMLVNGINDNPLKAQVDGTVDRYRNDLFSVTAADGSMKVNIQGGSLKALLDVRDVYVNKYQDNLNYVAQTLADSVNEVHTTGYDLNGVLGDVFFRMGNVDGRSAYKITAGTNELDITDIEKPLNDSANLGMLSVTSGRVSINGVSIYIDGEHDSLQSIVDKINTAGTGVTATIGPMNKLVLRADAEKGFKIESIQGLTSNLFEKLNILSTGGSYPENSLASGAGIEFTPAAPPALSIRINADITAMPSRIAASAGKDSDNDGIWDSPVALSDGTNALRIAQLQDVKLMQGGRTTVNGYYQETITEIGFDAERSQMLVDNQAVMVNALEQRRESISGVSLDEEMTNMVQFQHAFAASARFMSSVQEMLDMLVNMI